MKHKGLSGGKVLSISNFNPQHQYQILNPKPQSPILIPNLNPLSNLNPNIIQSNHNLNFKSLSQSSILIANAQSANSNIVILFPNFKPQSPIPILNP